VQSERPLAVRRKSGHDGGLGTPVEHGLRLREYNALEDEGIQCSDVTTFRLDLPLVFYSTSESRKYVDSKALQEALQNAGDLEAYLALCP
jgi:hypothetical protein